VLLSLLLAVLASGCAGAKPHPAEGLRPLPLLMAKDSLTRQMESLQPRVQWEAFLPPDDVQADKDGRLASVRPVTYHLRIWRAGGAASGVCAAPCVLPSEAHHALGEGVCSMGCVFPAELVYERRELAEPVHTLESPLAPATLYLWTVRARFDRGGQPRVTQWGVLLPSDRDRNLPPRRDPTIPSLGYYRFRTPSK
jgi:hypothetical protein